MRRFSKASIFALVTLATTAGAQDTDRQGRARTTHHGGAPSSPALDRSLPSDPVRRTWDFAKRFGIVSLGGRGGCGVEEQQARAALEASNRLLTEFLNGPRDPKKLGLERRKYLVQVLGAGRDIDTYSANFAAVGKRGPDGHVPSPDADICNAKGQRMSVLAIRDGLRGIGQVYPDMTEVGPALAKAEAALGRMGDDSAVAARVGGNRGSSLASVRLKPALSSNPEWISGFRDAFPTLAPGQTILKIHPYSAQWYIHKNPVTAIPEYRQIGAWIASRKADGTCWIHSLDLWQNYNGSGYERGQYRFGGAPQQILCENV